MGGEQCKKKSVETALDKDHKKAIIKLMNQAAYSTGVYRVFEDFLEMAAIELSNVVDFTHREEREKRYIEIANSYEKRHRELFPQMFGHLVEALEEKVSTTGPEDILGPIFHELELHNKYKGQFFTPQHVSDFMALAACGSDTQAAIEEKGYINMSEPCCGSGVMVTSMCKAMERNNLNYRTQLVVTAVDVDPKCVHMAYIQLALYGVPAVIIHGDTILMREWSRWYTPVYILDGWVWRQSCGLTDRRSVEDEMIRCASEPMYAALRQVEMMMYKDVTEAEPAPASVLDTAVETNERQEITNQIQLDLGSETVVSVSKPRYNRKKPPETADSTEQLSLFT